MKNFFNDRKNPSTQYIISILPHPTYIIYIYLCTTSIQLLMRNDLNKANSNAKAWLTKFSQHQTGSDFQRLRVVMGTQIRKHGEKPDLFAMQTWPDHKKWYPNPNSTWIFVTNPQKPRGNLTFFIHKPNTNPNPLLVASK